MTHQLIMHGFYAKYCPQELFHKGEKIRSLIANIDPDKQRLGLSTAEIEPESGDMLFNKVRSPIEIFTTIADFQYPKMA